MNADPIIYQDQLEKMSGYNQAAKIETWLKKMKIGYTKGIDGRISTTIAALDSITVKKPKATKVGF